MKANQAWPVKKLSTNNQSMSYSESRNRKSDGERDTQQWKNRKTRELSSWKKTKEGCKTETMGQPKRRWGRPGRKRSYNRVVRNTSMQKTDDGYYLMIIIIRKYLNRG